MRRLAIIALVWVFLLPACFPPDELPPPPPPPKELPPVAANLPPVPPGRQLVILDTPGDTATVARYAGTAMGTDSEGNIVTTDVTRPLCTTPCTYDLRPGVHTLQFTSTADSGRSDSLNIQLGNEPLVVRHIPEENTGQWGIGPELGLGITGLTLIPVGVSFAAVGLSDKTSGTGDKLGDEIWEGAGITLLVVGVASLVVGLAMGYAGRGEHRPAATTEWTLPPQPGQSPAANATSPAGMGDITARINSPDVFHLPARSEIPTMPVSLRGLKVLFADHIVGADAVSHLETSEQIKEGCAKDGAILAASMGWMTVQSPSQSHNLVWKADCSTSVMFTTASNGALYLLMPQGLSGSTLEAPDGRVIDEIPVPPPTMLCPVADQAQCTEAFSEYVHAYIISAVAHSTKLADYVAHNPATTTTPTTSEEIEKQLHKLDDLRSRKLITDEEYQRERERILDQTFAP
jgi:hypothetical protein